MQFGIYTIQSLVNSEENTHVLYCRGLDRDGQAAVCFATPPIFAQVLLMARGFRAAMPSPSDSQIYQLDKFTNICPGVPDSTLHAMPKWEYLTTCHPGIKTDIHKAPQPLSSANGFGMSRFSMAADIIICLCEWVHSLASHPSVLQSVMESGNVRPMGTQGGPLGRVRWQLTRMFCSTIWYCP